MADVERFLDGYRKSIGENRAELGVKHSYQRASLDASNNEVKEDAGTVDEENNEVRDRADITETRHIPNDDEFIRYDDEEDDDEHGREKRPIFGFLRRKKREMDLDDEYDDYDA